LSPSQKTLHAPSVSSWLWACYMTMVEHRYKALARELSTFANDQ